LLSENINYKIEETEMNLALGSLSAGINHLQLASGNISNFDLTKYTLG